MIDYLYGDYLYGYNPVRPKIHNINLLKATLRHIDYDNNAIYIYHTESDILRNMSTIFDLNKTAFYDQNEAIEAYKTIIDNKIQQLQSQISSIILKTKEKEKHIRNIRFLKSSYARWEKNNYHFLYVYGACDDDGLSFIYNSPPEKINDRWNTKAGYKSDKSLCLYLIKENLFPKDKPQKFKLVAMEN